MTADQGAGLFDAQGLPPVLRAFGTPSFTELLGATHPGLLPGAVPTGVASTTPGAGPVAPAVPTPHGTTIVAVTYRGGVLMAGDRRATVGNVIAQRDIEKVFPADEFSCVGIAGSAGIAIELVRLFQMELRHYEKIEGTVLSLEGKANRLSAMIRNNLGLAMQGLAAVPLFAGYDAEAGHGRVFSYDLTGGRYEEEHFHAVGSGSLFARSALKKLFRPDLDAAAAAAVCVEALYDAADDDSATGGPDLTRRIFPVVALVDAAGYSRLAEPAVAATVEAMVALRHARPDGPLAPMPATAEDGAPS